MKTNEPRAVDCAYLTSCGYMCLTREEIAEAGCRITPKGRDIWRDKRGKLLCDFLELATVSNWMDGGDGDI